MINNKITTTEIFEEDKKWLRKQKDNHSFQGLKDVIHAIRKLLTRHKMDGELKWTIKERVI